MTMEWYFTWQDPAALTLALGGLILVWRLRSHLDKGEACSSCGEPSGSPSPDHVSIVGLGIGRSAEDRGRGRLASTPLKMR